MNLTEQFLDLYKQVEDETETIYGIRTGSSFARLEHMQQFQSLASGLRCCREVRNLLQHNAKIDGEYAVHPSENLLNILKTVLNTLKNRAYACDIAVKTNNIHYRSPEDLVLESMRFMKKNDLSKLPILKDGRITGIFSHEAVFAKTLIPDTHPIDEDTRFYHLNNFIRIDEKYYRFAPYKAPIDDIEKIYNDAYSRHIRIRIIFLTENGKQNEKLLGLITPWELLDKK